MNLSNLTDAFKSGGGMKDPIGSITGSLSSSISQLASSGNPTLQALASTLSSTISSANTAISGITSKLSTTLPLMKAADGISAKMGALKGEIPSADGGASFKAAFGPITDAKAKLSEVQSVLSPANMTAILSGNSSAIASLSSKVSSAQSGISQSISSQASGVTDSISNLKGYSFAKFSTMDHPPHVKAILDSCVANPVPYELARAENLPTPTNMVPPVSTDRIPAVPTINPTKVPEHMESPVVATPAFNIDSLKANLAAIGYNGITPGIDFRTDYCAYVETLSSKAAEDYKNVVTVSATAKAYRDSRWPNYTTLKAAALANPSDAAAQSAYKTVLDEYATSAEYKAASDATDAYNLERKNILRLREQLSMWTRTNFAGVTAGPPW